MPDKIVSDKTAVVILAAGKGSRMKSSKPKVMHELAGAPLIQYVAATASGIDPEKIVAVIAPGMEESVGKAVSPHDYVLQTEQKGTGHAVACAKESLKDFDGMVLVMLGDVPLIRAETLDNMMTVIQMEKEKPSVMLLGMSPHDPTGYGRIIVNEDGSVDRIVEQADCNDEEKKVRLCWSGIMAVDGKHLFDWLDQIGDNNAQGEVYLTSIVEIAKKHGKKTGVVECDVFQVQGINSKADLARAEYAVQQILRNTHLDKGVQMVDPETVYFSIDTKIGEDCLIEPNVFFGREVEIAKGAHVKAFSHIEGCRIHEDAIVGPFARLRPGSEIAKEARIGNFVEIKKSKIGKGSKVSHLSYIGDTTVGENVNIGAGTITCNYDGYFKYQTRIDDGAFVGSNSALIAPVHIGEKTIVAAGSTVTKDVEDGALVASRGKQRNIENWATEFHEKMSKSKKASKKAS